MEMEGIAMIYMIQNERLIVKIDSRGAELKSIKKVDDKDDVEYMWQGNPDVWESQAPLLFPIIGRLKDEEYLYNEKLYKIDIHGFARKQSFSVNKASETEIEFQSKCNRATLELYPFRFVLTIVYRLEGDKIIKIHTVKNDSNLPMPYEIGGHEGYNLALFESEKMEDYYIEFKDMKEIKTYTADENVMMNKEKEIVELEDEKLYLEPKVFENDALIIDEFNERKVRLRNNKNNRGVDVEFEDFKYLGIWTKPFRTNYICIEPWSSLPDGNYLGKELVEKQDIRILEPNKSESLKYTIRII